MTQLVDQWGRPLRKEVLARDISGPTLAGIRQVQGGYPANGLTPLRLARILRDADDGEPLSYFELAEQIEERDLHYAGVLGTRKRSVSQVDVTVEAASDSAEDVRRADMVREWLKRDELADETFDILDAIGKGISWSEIIWDTSEGQYFPKRLEWRDPRFFRIDRDGASPLLRGGIEGNGQDEALPAFKFIQLSIKAKSGLAVRSGIARIAAWAWMFKAYTQRDWTIFTQTYGQPVRIGKYHPGATKEDRATLYRAVANIAGDCAAIVPEGMSIDFVESSNVTAGSDLYEKRSDWLDRQISKAVLGQTGTTDTKSGGLGDGGNQVHRETADDIETADCKALSAVLNRDLIRPWCDLEYGPPTGRFGYPRLIIARPQQEDLQLLSSSLAQLVPLGLKVSASQIRDKFGLDDPGEKDELLAPEAPALPAPTLALPSPTHTALQQREDSAHPAEQLARQLAEQGQGAVGDMVATIETMLDRARDLGEFRAMLAQAYGDIDTGNLAGLLATGLMSAHAAGRSDLADEAD